MASYKQRKHGSRPVESLMWRVHSCPSLLGLDGVGRAFLLAALDVDSLQGPASALPPRAKKLWASVPEALVSM